MERRELEIAIATLEALVDDTNTTEADLQRFFEEHPAAFQSLGFSNAYPRHSLVAEGRRDRIPDFLLARPDGSIDVLDLKRHQPPVVRNPGDRAQFRAHVETGIAQLTDYAEWFNDQRNRLTLSEQLAAPVEPDPDLHLVIGRTGDSDNRSTIRHLERQHTGRLYVQTYDDVLNEMRSFHAHTFGQGAGLPGASVYLAMSVLPQERATPTVVLSAGRESTGTWELAIGSGNSIVVTVVTAHGDTLGLTIPGSIAQIQDHEQTMLTLQFGSTTGRSIMEMAVNGHIVGTVTYPGELPMPQGTDLGGMTLGADRDGQRATRMTLTKVAVFGEVHSLADRLAVSKAFTA